MYLVQLHTKPKAKSKDAKKTGGAYVNCWINFSIKGGAELLARHYVEKGDWRILGRAKSTWVTEKTYNKEDVARKYYAEALKDGASLVFHNYPVRRGKILSKKS
jgi:hypothetical protein